MTSSRIGPIALLVFVALAFGSLATIPGQASAQAPPSRPTFTPYTDPPSLLNREEVAEALAQRYPPILREAGVGGTATVWFYIDDSGTVGNMLMNQATGHPALDAAAIEVASVFRFSPARNRDERVPVWISLPITFRPR